MAFDIVKLMGEFEECSEQYHILHNESLSTAHLFIYNVKAEATAIEKEASDRLFPDFLMHSGFDVILGFCDKMVINDNSAPSQVAKLLIKGIKEYTNYLAQKSNTKLLECNSIVSKWADEQAKNILLPAQSNTENKKTKDSFLLPSPGN